MQKPAHVAGFFIGTGREIRTSDKPVEVRPSGAFSYRDALGDVDPASFVCPHFHTGKAQHGYGRSILLVAHLHE
jgi:hypothetical protein